jgi:hypothetical protein
VGCQHRHAGITAGGNGPGTAIVDNVLIGNQEALGSPAVQILEGAEFKATVVKKP